MKEIGIETKCADLANTTIPTVTYIKAYLSTIWLMDGAPSSKVMAPSILASGLKTNPTEKDDTNMPINQLMMDSLCREINTGSEKWIGKITAFMKENGFIICTKGRGPLDGEMAECIRESGKMV